MIYSKAWKPVGSTYLMAMNVWGYDLGSNHYPMLSYPALLPLSEFSLLCTMTYKLLKLGSTSFSPPWMLCLTTASQVIESSDCGLRPLKHMIPNQTLFSLNCFLRYFILLMGRWVTHYTCLHNCRQVFHLFKLKS